MQLWIKCPVYAGGGAVLWGWTTRMISICNALLTLFYSFSTQPTGIKDMSSVMKLRLTRQMSIYSSFYFFVLIIFSPRSIDPCCWPSLSVGTPHMIVDILSPASLWAPVLMFSWYHASLNWSSHTGSEAELEIS